MTDLSQNHNLQRFLAKGGGVSDGIVSGVASSPDGLRLATASEDQSVRLWDARSGREIMALGGQEGAANQVVFSPDGNRIAAASSDGTARVWEAEAD